MFLPQPTDIILHGWSGKLLSAAEVSIVLTPDIGGRIMSLVFQGKELFYVHSPEEGKIYAPESAPDIHQFKRQFGFRLFGGDKTWIAPEKDWLCGAPPVELDAGRYAFECRDGVCAMTSPLCRETGLRVIRRVSLDGNGTVRLQEELENKTDRPILRGIWNVTQLHRPFDVYIACSPDKMRSYHLQDASLPAPGQRVAKVGAWSCIACHSSVCFKFGGVPDCGRLFTVRTFRDGLIAFAREFAVDGQAHYAHGSAVEVFNSAQFPYSEIEVHGPLAAILPAGGRVSFQQLWHLRAFPVGTSPEEMAAKLFPIMDS